MVELVDVAKIWKQKTAEAIYPGLNSVLAKFRGKRSIKNFKDSTAFKTGNLVRKFVQANARNEDLVSQIVSGNVTTYQLFVNIAPKGAEYGEYVHNGTSKMGERPFARIGAEQVEVKRKVDEFTKGVAQQKANQTNVSVQAIFGKLAKP